MRRSAIPIARINGINLNYRVQGQGEPLVMIMGLSATLDGWKYQVPAFQQHFRVVTFDNRGVGASSKPVGPYSIQMMADDAVGQVAIHAGSGHGGYSGTDSGRLETQHAGSAFLD